MIQLRVANFERSLVWYRDVLGLTVLLRQSEEGFALLDLGGVRLALKRRMSTAPDALPVSEGPMLMFAVANATTAVAHLAASGTPIIKPLEANLEGYRRAIVADPDGYPIALFDFVSPSGPEVRSADL
jgi:catechol 2,3-dioxygenase-like lactoylglutathione lyase family enzyme